MKAYWLVAILLSQVITLPLTEGGDDDEEEEEDKVPPKLLADFVKVAVKQLKDDPSFAGKIKDVLGDLKEAFSSKEYEGTFIPAVTKMLDTFLNNGFFISPDTLLKIMKSVVNQATREPDKVTNNLRRVWHRSVKTVGDTVKNVGSIGSAAVRVVEDLYNKQREYTNPIFAKIPYIGRVLQTVNDTIAKIIGYIHLVVKIGVKGTGTAISDYAEKKRARLKEKAAEERRAAKEAQEIEDEKEEGKDSDEEPEEDTKSEKKLPTKKDDETTPPTKEDKKPKKKDGKKPTPPKKKEQQKDNTTGN